MSKFMKGVFCRPSSLCALLTFFLVLGRFESYSQIFILEDTARNLTAEQALDLLHASKFEELKNERFNPGFTNSVFWLLVKPKNLEKEQRLIIGNAHINKIEFYKTNELATAPELIYLTGDHYPFRQRPLPNRLFAFPLEASEGNTVWLLRIDKHHESLQLTAQLLGLDEYYEQRSVSALINGALAGVLILIILLGGFLFIVTKDKLYLFYALYLLVAWLWVFADKGYGYQYLWPDYPYFASRARPLFMSLSFIALLQFMKAFIGQTNTSRWYKWIGGLQIILSILAVISMLNINHLQGGNIGKALLLFMLPVGLLSFSLMALSIIEKAREGNKLVWYYSVSVSMYVCFGLLELIAHSGFWLFSDYYFSNFGLQTGLIAEAIILLYGLAIQFNIYRKEREQLLLDINKKQEELTTKVFETQETERKKIADQLHDEVGSMLSVVSLNISSVLEKRQEHPQSQIKLQSAFEALGSASALVRNISHTLTPIAIEKYGFKRAVENLVASINTSEKLKIETVIIGFDRSDLYSVVMLNDLFRSIQEILNNAIKHSGASHAYLELIEHDDVISLMIEDNGRGIKQDQKRGNGLENIFSRVNYLKGTIDINSSADKGTLIVIEIPTNQN